MGSRDGTTGTSATTTEVQKKMKGRYKLSRSRRAELEEALATVEKSVLHSEQRTEVLV